MEDNRRNFEEEDDDEEEDPDCALHGQQGSLGASSTAASSTATALGTAVGEDADEDTLAAAPMTPLEQVKRTGSFPQQGGLALAPQWPQTPQEQVIRNDGCPWQDTTNSEPPPTGLRRGPPRLASPRQEATGAVLSRAAAVPIASVGGAAGGGVPLRQRPPSMTEVLSSGTPVCQPEASPDRAREGLMGLALSGGGAGGLRRPRSLNLATPSSCSSVTYRNAITPGTPDPLRADFKLVTGDVAAVLFDFDGTLTASPGDAAQRCRKQAELLERTPLLAPRLRALRDASLTLGIISKSSERTVLGAISEAGLRELFDGPVLGSAVGLEGKAGFIEELIRHGPLRHLGSDGLRRVLLIDDDVRELERARQRGIQTYAAPKEGGLQEEDFDEIFSCLGLVQWIARVSSGPMQTPPPMPHLGTMLLANASPSGGGTSWPPSPWASPAAAPSSSCALLAAAAPTAP